jgi:hypothetical protein
VLVVREARGWLDEFDCDEATFVTIKEATHHVHEEQPTAVAAALIKFAELPSQRVLSKESGHISSTGIIEAFVLPPPCPFVRGFDAVALQTYREGNILNRMGSFNGSKGEFDSSPRTPPSPASPSGMGGRWVFIHGRPSSDDVATDLTQLDVATDITLSPSRPTPSLD